MRIHHLNCATMCPMTQRLFNGEGSLFKAGHMVGHCLLLENSRGLTLVDTGLGTQDIMHPWPSVGLAGQAILRAQLKPSETAIAHVHRLGFSPDDVRDIVLTHLDFDHAGGLRDFPKATIHVSAPEHRVAVDHLSLLNRRRYSPVQWSHKPLWKEYEEGGDTWMGFAGVREIDGHNGQVLLVPLHGHTSGHCGVAVRRDRGWLLHAGDAYFHRWEVDPVGDHGPIGAKLLQQVFQSSPRERLHNQARLRDLQGRLGPPISIISSHDPAYLDNPDLTCSIASRTSPTQSQGGIETRRSPLPYGSHDQRPDQPAARLDRSDAGRRENDPAGRRAQSDRPSAREGSSDRPGARREAP